MMTIGHTIESDGNLEQARSLLAWLVCAWHTHLFIRSGALDCSFSDMPVFRVANAVLF